MNGGSSADAARVADDKEQSDHDEADQDPGVHLRLDQRFAAFRR
jgi:hypothetical protein